MGVKFDHTHFHSSRVKSHGWRAKASGAHQSHWLLTPGTVHGGAPVCGRAQRRRRPSVGSAALAQALDKPSDAQVRCPFAGRVCGNNEVARHPRDKAHDRRERRLRSAHQAPASLSTPGAGFAQHTRRRLRPLADETNELHFYFTDRFTQSFTRVLSWSYLGCSVVASPSPVKRLHALAQ